MQQKKTIVIPKLPYGEGSISQRKDGTLTYRKRIGEGKKKVPVFVYGNTVKEVMGKMKEKEKNLSRKEKDKKVKEIKETLYESMDNWLKNYKQPMLKPTSYDRIECTLNNQIKGTFIGTSRYQTVTSDEIQSHLANLVKEGYSWSTIKKTFDLLSEFYYYKTIHKQIEDNPMMLVNMISKENVLKPEKEIEFFEDEDIVKFKNEATKVMKHRNLPKYSLGYAFVFIMFTGIRAGEAIALRWKDISFSNKTVMINKSMERIINREYDENNTEEMKRKGITKYIDKEGSTKTKATRLLSLNKQALESIEQVFKYTKFKDPDDFVFPTRDGKCNNITNMTKRLNFIQEEANMKIKNSGLHVLRHTCASLLFRKNIPIEIIASLLGHSVDVCRETYLHFVQEQKAEAINQLDNFNFDIDIK